MANRDRPRTPDTADAPRDYRLEAQVGFLLRKAHQRHRSIFSKSIGVKLAPTQFAALASLHTEGPTSQNQLGRRTAMDSATITGVIDRLAQRGLVQIRQSPDDDRMNIIDLSEAGRALVKELLPRAKEISSETVAPLTTKEAQTLVHLLSKIADL